MRDIPAGQVLIIDDSTHSAELLKAQLELAGYAVHVASSGEEGLEAIEANPPDVVLLDIVMPGMDGYEVLEQLKSRETAEAIPVIVLTSLNERTDKLRALELGATDFLSKPVDQAELLARIRWLVHLRVANQRLSQSNAEYRDLIERLPVVSYIAVSRGGESRAEFVSPQIEGALGFTLAEWSADPGLWVRQMHPDDRRHFESLLTHATAQGHSISMESRFQARDGRHVWFANLATAVIDAESGGVRVNGFLVDISDQKRAEEDNRQLAEAVERERQRLAQVMAAMTEGVLLIDAAGCVGYCNAKAVELLDTDAGAITGVTVEHLFQSLSERLANREAALHEMQSALAMAGAHPSFDLELLGTPRRHLVVKLFPVDLDGEQDVGLLIHDVSQERELARTKDELLSVVSHELRTPMASLVGFAELLLSRTYDDQQRREFLTIMHQEGRRLTALINDYLDLQRMESGRLAVHPQPTPLGPLMRRAVVAAGDDPERPIILELTEADELTEVDADPDRVLQVLANLLSNARKYSPDGGPVRLWVTHGDRGVRIHVQDQGLGLPKEARGRLFEKFFRVDHADRRSITGTGLGLAICRQIVTEHGGRIGVHSQGLGQGSEFWFTLPRSKPNPSSGDVLIVEDNSGFSRLLEAELAALGLSAVRVPSAEAALDHLATNRPKAIALDLLMPGTSGEQFLELLQASGNNPPSLVVITVKDLTAEERKWLTQLGVAAIFSKGPTAASDAAEVLADLVSRYGRAPADRSLPKTASQADDCR